MRKLLHLLTIFICFLVISFSAFAQASIGSISGRVSDASGAAVPNVRVELENVATGQRIVTTTGPDGMYTLTDVPVGTYRIVTIGTTAAPATTQQVYVEMGRTGTINLTMPSGPSTEPMISAENVPTSMSTASIQNNYTTRQIHYLPQPNFIARDGSIYGAYNLGLLGEGQTSGAIGQQERGPAVGGTRPISNTFHIEGIDNNNKVNPGPLVYVSNEATTEFALFQNQPAPLFGHATGGNWNSAVRTGTNQLHGSFYDYLQNRNLNAMPASYRALGYTDYPRYDQNRLGGSLGLPIVPSKIFFFGNFEYIPLGYRAPLSANAYAPTAAGFATLSRISGVSATNLGILQNSTGQVGAAGRFTTVTGVSIPLGLVNTEIRGWQNQYMGTGAGDINMSDKDQIHLRYVHNELDSNNSGAALPGFSTGQRNKSLLATAGWYHSFGDAFVNELRFGFNRYAQFYDPNNFSFGTMGVFPNIQIGGQNNLGLGNNFTAASRAAINTYHIADGASISLGGHTIRFGGDVRRYLGFQGGQAAFRGVYGYSSLERFLLDLPPDVSSTRSFGNDTFDMGQWLAFGYVQDTWTLAPHISVNLGLRYEYATVPGAYQNSRGLTNEFSTPLAGTKNFAPYVGVAFAPSTMTVFRLGAGMHYDAVYSGAYYGLTGFNPTFSRTAFGNLQSNTPGFLNSGGLRDPFASVNNVVDQQIIGATTSLFGGQRLPYSMQWNAAVEQAIWRNMSIELKYMGSRGVNLPLFERLNANPLGVSATRNLPVFFSTPTQAELNALPLTLNQLQTGVGGSLAQAGFTSPLNSINWGGNSWYHAFAATLSHRFTGGFQFFGNYTWSRFEDDSTGTPLDLAGFGRTRYWSLYDHRHHASATLMYELAPLFRNTPVATIFADFAISGTYSYESPGRLPVVSGFDPLNPSTLGGGIFFNPNGQVGVGSGVSPLRNSQGQVVGYLGNNPNAQFVAGGPGTFGTAGRTGLRLGETNNFDVAAEKRFTWGDKWSFEVRGEAYNLFNHKQFTGSPINNLGSRWMNLYPGYLVPTNPEFNNLDAVYANNARILQVALRVVF